LEDITSCWGRAWKWGTSMQERREPRRDKPVPNLFLPRGIWWFLALGKMLNSECRSWARSSERLSTFQQWNCQDENFRSSSSPDPRENE
jgi:hypothetical protein